MHSCLYEGYVQHRRFTPANHAFRYGLYMAYLDLEELPGLLELRCGLSRFAFSPATFRRGDHLGDPQLALVDAVRATVEQETAWRPTGPIRLLTLLRNWGYYFSPLNLYYCFDPQGVSVNAVVAEVTNTPWLERHVYVLWQGNRTGDSSQLGFRQSKAFHVSPFMDMDLCYEWFLHQPGANLSVGIVSRCQSESVFEVGMELKRREWSRRSMLRSLARYPWMTGRVVQAIYWQAFWLWWKKCPYYAHPRHRQSAREPSQ